MRGKMIYYSKLLEEFTWQEKKVSRLMAEKVEKSG